MRELNRDDLLEIICTSLDLKRALEAYRFLVDKVDSGDEMLEIWRAMCSTVDSTLIIFSDLTSALSAVELMTAKFPIQKSSFETVLRQRMQDDGSIELPVTYGVPRFLDSGSLLLG